MGKTNNTSLWETFQEFWPAWVEHVDFWEDVGNNAIRVVFRNDGYMTANEKYLFSSKKEGDWALKRVKGKD